jgi:hypothetical protein
MVFSKASKKENILDFSQYLNKEVIVKFNGGREGVNNTSIHKIFSLVL